ncbi:MAG: tetratricopeptide repeat protein [Chitinophagaceae bacterium]|nr:MAG: tetratricopeptide repeat protein [Chitinophagaceae bacterium]
MNFCHKVFRWLPLLVLAVCIGCGSEDKPDVKTDILKKSPFKSITDSIARFPDMPGMYLDRAVRLSQHNQLELATADFRKAWQLSQDENVALEYVSNLLMVNKVEEAMSVLKEGAQKFPENTEFNRRLGEIYAETDNTQAALKQFDDIIAKEPGNFEAWYDKGHLLAKLKDTNGAITALEQSFALQPVSYTGIALANLHIGRKDKRALAICNYLIARDSAEIQTDAVFTKGVFYAETGDRKKALEQFEECIRRDWKLTDAYIEKGIIFYQQQQLDTALSTFNLSVTVSNTNPDGYFWIGRCYEAMNNNEKAIENYQRALSLDRTFMEAAERIKRLRNS